MLDHVSQTLARRASRRFRSEDGNIATFSMILFTLMVMCGGLAVDLMRYEQIRTLLQQTLDRCTLAGAALQQGLDPEAVCRDYVAKAGLTQYLTEVRVTEGLNFRQVEAYAMAEKPTFFASMVGIDEFNIPGDSSAEQRITDIEIAMVLDVSGSMAGTKLTNMKAAAKEFVDTVLASDIEDRTSVALVPYNGQVNIGPLLAAKYNISPQHNIVADVNCVDLPASVYSSNTLSRTLALPQTGFVDTFTNTNTSNSWLSATATGNPSGATPIETNMWCPPRPQNIIRLPSNNIATLQGQIDGLSAIGATSINAGMKWGMTMLDPANRPMFAEFISANQIPGAFTGRPFEYVNDNQEIVNKMKVIVLMTDGSNFAEDRLKDAFRAGSSPIWRGASDSNYSIFHAGKVDYTSATTICNSRPFWVPHTNSGAGAWHSRPWNGTAPSGTACYSTTAIYTGASSLTWPQVWQRQRMSWVAWQLYARGLGTTSTTRTTVYNETIAAMRERTSIDAMDAQLQNVCNMARDQNVIVFGIAFEAPALGQTQIRNCATTTSQYYEASGTNIRASFQAIAAQISQLRLTQ
jgi:Putative Flp pilus-assembly TadE/G-like/von Willebrand factor type A domain